MKITVIEGKPRKISEEKLIRIQSAIENGYYLELQELLKPDSEREKEKEEADLDNQTINLTYNLPVSGKEHVTEAEIMYHIYNSLPYEGTKDSVMDSLSKYMDRHGIDKKNLRFAAKNIDDEYSIKYQSQYDSTIRDFLSGSDLEAVLTEDEKDAYYEEKYRAEEEQEEEEEEEYSYI